jgi:Flp pilus assembly protein protease CpaA
MVLYHPEERSRVSGILAPALTLPWLAVAAIADLRSRRVSNWLILPPLAASLVFVTISGQWTLALLVVLMVAFSNLPLGWSAGLALAYIAGMSFFLNQGTSSLDALLLFLIWFAWKVGVTGGADAKVLFTLTLLYGGGILLAVLLAGGIFGLGAWIGKKRSIPYLSPVFLGSTVYFLFRYLGFV